MLSFQRSVVEEAILYIEQLERQLWMRLQQTKAGTEAWTKGGGRKKSKDADLGSACNVEDSN